MTEQSNQQPSTETALLAERESMHSPEHIAIVEGIIAAREKH